MARVEREMGGVARWLRRVRARYRGELVGLARHCFRSPIAPISYYFINCCDRFFKSSHLICSVRCLEGPGE